MGFTINIKLFYKLPAVTCKHPDRDVYPRGLLAFDRRFVVHGGSNIRTKYHSSVSEVSVQTDRCGSQYTVGLEGARTRICR